MKDSSTIGQVFSERLRAERSRRVLTQKALGELAGVHQTHIAHFEAGRWLPSVPNLLAIAEALGVTTDYLLGHEAA